MLRLRLHTRIKSLEDLLLPNREAEQADPVVTEAVKRISDEDLELLISGSMVVQQGRELTVSESAAVDRFSLLLNEERQRTRLSKQDHRLVAAVNTYRY